MRGIDESDRIDISINMDQFEHEARDFNQHNIQDFLLSSMFKKEFRCEGRNIKTIAKV